MYCKSTYLHSGLWFRSSRADLSMYWINGHLFTCHGCGNRSWRSCVILWWIVLYSVSCNVVVMYHVSYCNCISSSWFMCLHPCQYFTIVRECCGWQVQVFVWIGNRIFRFKLYWSEIFDGLKQVRRLQCEVSADSIMDYGQNVLLSTGNFLCSAPSVNSTMDFSKKLVDDGVVDSPLEKKV